MLSSFTGLLGLVVCLTLPGQSATALPYSIPQPVHSTGRTTDSMNRLLTDALNDLKQLYGVDILYGDQLVRGVMVPAILIDQKANLEDNLKVLLKNTGLQFRKVKNGAYLITGQRADKKLSASIKSVPESLPPTSSAEIILSEAAEKTYAVAVDRAINGQVLDELGVGLPGVSVVLKGTQRGTVTDKDGLYRLSVPDGAATLTFSFVGYISQEVPFANQSAINVTLKPEAKSLEEVVVVGYGTVRKKDLTGAITSVTAKDFNKGNFTSPDQLIQGKVSGVQIINNSGQPGGAATVKIRGNSAITGTGQPLYVVDGVPLDNRSARPGLNANGLGNTPGGNPLNFLNPADIASIDVLKDASATAIYGSRAAYGVVIINTKRGQAGQAKIDIGMNTGVASIFRKINVLNAEQYREAIKYYGVSAANDRGGNADGFGSILRKGVQQNYTLAISGGNETGKYRISAGYLNQEGIINRTGFKKYTANFSGNLKFLESKRLGLDITVNSSQYIENIAPITNDAGSNGSLIGQALQWNPTDSLRKANGSLNIKAGAVINPLAMSELYSDVSKVTTILASISPYYKFTDWLEYRMLYSVNYSAGGRRASINQDINNSATLGKGWASISNNELSTQQFTHTLNFNKDIAPDLNLNALVGFEYMSFANKGAAMSALGPASGFGNYGLDYTDYIQYSNTTGRVLSSFVDPSADLQSYFGRAIVNYKDRYLVTATLRSDGSSKFGANNKYGYFPSFSASWNISNEKFFQLNAITSLKLRGGWGKTGNQEFPSGSSQARYSFTDNGGLGQTNNPNPDLKWQSDKQYNFGFDLAVLGNRITATVDYFNKTTTDLLFPSPPIQPAPPGSVIRWINLDGRIENKGLEVAIDGNIIKKSNFSWDLGVNATFIKNSVSGLTAPILTGALNGPGLSGVTVEVIRNGLPINAFFTRRYLGMNESTGLANYEDAGNTFFYVGNPNPKALLGLSTTLRYKKLSLIANMNGAFGMDIYNNTNNAVISVGLINGGRNIGLSLYQQPVKESIANPVTPSSRFLERGDYLKMNNATLSYALGNIARVIRGANVYVTGQNLFVITKYTGFDPEVNVNKAVNSVPSVGIDYAAYPSARTITFGVNFSL
ncbi:SusC/RagA family TonB-linked outer membrane protein [Spirosoma fluviale]|uniref:Iron complex outermembrane recepter protein n=1 Tax=Spirosoma fluviale TaxID=1597977 RepID=A0A286G4A5_9BACT|nr:SusC/RagA family TonB-linked outer membrane protein [Spirosoma fluviale]SOD90345.1 iron complex outermembrane recepter protein [Spirosoma fluviale]